MKTIESYRWSGQKGDVKVETEVSQSGEPGIIIFLVHVFCMLY
jgi:hypothetical protein